jgi:hypothetical protein
VRDHGASHHQWRRPGGSAGGAYSPSRQFGPGFRAQRTGVVRDSALDVRSGSLVRRRRLFAPYRQRARSRYDRAFDEPQWKATAASDTARVSPASSISAIPSGRCIQGLRSSGQNAQQKRREQASRKLIGSADVKERKMDTPLERIMGWPLKADERSVRGAATGYHVATISDGMNDRGEYARLFAAAPSLLVALRSLADEVSDLRRQNAIDENYDIQRIDGVLSYARMIIAKAAEE